MSIHELLTSNWRKAALAMEADERRKRELALVCPHCDEVNLQSVINIDLDDDGRRAVCRTCSHDFDVTNKEQ